MCKRLLDHRDRPGRTLSNSREWQSGLVDERRGSRASVLRTALAKTAAIDSTALESRRKRSPSNIPITASQAAGAGSRASRRAPAARKFLGGLRASDDGLKIVQKQTCDCV